MPHRFTVLLLGSLLGLVVWERPARAVTCDGNEVLCLDLTTQAEVTASGGTVVGGDFNASGFQPSNQGGLDWNFGFGTDFTWGRLEVDVEGLLPVDAAELAGGKVSIFSLCGEPPDDNEYIGFQKMPPDYRDGHIFRYGMDDDGLADNWDAVIITGAGFNCYYSINDPPWQLGETHHITAEWDSTGLTMWIDGWTCSKPGNGDTFDPVEKLFVLSNRCTHYPNQHAVARFRNLQLWALAHNPTDCTPETMIEAVSLSPTAGSGLGGVFHAVYRHCLDAAQFRIVQIMVADEATAGVPMVGGGFENGEFSFGGDTCAPGENVVLSDTWGYLDCGQSSATPAGQDMVVDWALSFNTSNFTGTHNVYFDAKGGPGTPEPRLGWTQMGTYTVVASSTDAGVTPQVDGSIAPDAAPGADAAPGVDAADDPDGASGGCACRHSRGEGSAGLLLLLLVLLILRRRSGCAGRATTST